MCRRPTLFSEQAEWLRDSYHCVRCWSIPRQRALISKLDDLFEDLASLEVHESSPHGASSDYLAKVCRRYSASRYYPEIEPGRIHRGYRSENLEQMTFAPESFDLFVTQDVMEHVLKPLDAFAEIGRVLKPGGAHVFTVPLYKGRTTRVRARECDGEIEYLEPEEFHVNPIDDTGSLVVTEWGDDIADVISEASGMTTTVTSYFDRSLGLDGEFLDVLVSIKPDG